MSENNCFDCKYFEEENNTYVCTHPYGESCVDCSLWWGKDVEPQLESEE